MRFRTLRGRWARSGVLLVALGCGAGPEAPPPSVGEAFGRIVGETVYVVPSHHWEWVDGRWRFHAKGEFVVHVAGPPSRDLRFELAAAPDSRGYQATVRWDGREWTPQRHPFGDELEVSIPREELTPGTHRLTLERDYRWDREHVPEARPVTRFDVVGYRIGHRTVPLDPAAGDRYRKLREFLTLGTTGVGPEVLGGVLFDGAGRLVLAAEGSGRLQTTVENLASVSATVELSAGDRRVVVELAPSEHRDLSLGISRDESIEVAVDVDTGLVLVGSLHQEREWEERPPSILLVTLDTTRRDLVAPWAATDTPNLAAFAAGATVFERALATSPWTLPSHSSILTGLWPGEHGAGYRTKELPWELVTLPERLRGAGYFTSGFAGGFLAHHQFGLAQGMHRYRDPEGFETKAEPLTDAIETWLAAEPPAPWFLLANYFDSHAVYRAPDPYREQFGVEPLERPLRERPVWGSVVAGETRELSAAIRGEGGFDDDVRDYLRAAYRAELAYVDDELGRLFAGLRRRGLWDDTMVVVAADHGELLGERDLFTHAHLLEPELIEIPMVIKWPRQTEGTRVTVPVSQVDLFPTLLRAARQPIPEDQRGLLLHPEADSNLAARPRLFFEEHHAAPHPLFEEMRRAEDLYGYATSDLWVTAWEDQVECRRRGGTAWSLVSCPDDVWDRSRIEDVVGGGGDPPAGPEGAEVGMSEAERAALEALGYL